MNVIRPICESDLEVLCQIAVDSGPGFTSLPENTELLNDKIRCSDLCFSTEKLEPGPDQTYLFVMEESETREVIGTCGIVAAVGMAEPWYHYRIGTVVHSSRELRVHNTFKTLYMCNDYTGCSEVCTLFLKPDYRHSNNGSLLSKSRFMFMAEFPERFASKVIAEMRGFSDDQGYSPFWDGLGRHFFTMEYSEADYLTGSGNKVFIAELMPKHTQYIHMLPEPAQQAIGKVHKNTEPARRMLEAEGFRFEGYVDIFDAGPTLASPLNDVRAIRESHYVKARICHQPPESNQIYMISSRSLLDFRCTMAALTPSGSAVDISEELAQALLIEDGDTVRIAALKPRN